MINTNLRVGTADPGGKRDSFFFILLVVNVEKRIIYITGGREWKFIDNQIGYPEIERGLANIHKKANLDFLVVEQNNTGIHAIQSMKQKYHIPIIGIKTGGIIKERRIMQKGDTMDKTEHVGWVNMMRQKGQILISGDLTPELKKLISQLNSFVRKRTDAGKITYSAQGSQSDDAVMALMVGTFYIRRKIFGEMGGGKHHTVFKKYNAREISQQIKTAIPSDMVLTGRDVVMPTGFSMPKYRIH